MEQDLIWIARLGRTSVGRLESGKWWATVSINNPKIGASVKVESEFSSSPTEAVTQLRQRVEAVVGRNEHMMIEGE